MIAANELCHLKEVVDLHRIASILVVWSRKLSYCGASLIGGKFVPGNPRLINVVQWEIFFNSNLSTRSAPKVRYKHTEHYLTR